MKGVLEFNLPEERIEFEQAQKGTLYKSQLEDVWNECFRPNRKHGYHDQELQELIDKLGEDGYNLIEKIAEIYLSILHQED